MAEKVVIIGSGPAGLAAAIYTARANLSPLMFEGTLGSDAGLPGGQKPLDLLTPLTPESIAGAGTDRSTAALPDGSSSDDESGAQAGATDSLFAGLTEDAPAWRVLKLGMARKAEEHETDAFSARVRIDERRASKVGTPLPGRVTAVHVELGQQRCHWLLPQPCGLTA